MPDKCCVLGCRSNYSSKLEGYVPVFRFPKEPIQRGLWLQNINRTGWEPTKYSVVCANHFSESAISKTEIFKDASGIWRVFPRKKWELHPDAVPSIFATDAGTVTSVMAQDPEDQTQRITVYHDAKVTRWTDKDTIKNFSSFQKDISSQTKKFDQWMVNIDERKVVLYMCSFDEIPRITKSVTVHSDMVCCVCVDGKILTRDQLKGFFPHTLKLHMWSQVENLLIHLSNFKKYEMSPKQKKNKLISSIQEMLPQLLNAMSEDTASENGKQFRFLCDQFSLFFTKRRKYSADTIFLSSMVYDHSPSCYAAIRETGFLIFPHAKYFQRFGCPGQISRISVQEENDLNFTTTDVAARVCREDVSYITDRPCEKEKVISTERRQATLNRERMEMADEKMESVDIRKNQQEVHFQRIIIDPIIEEIVLESSIKDFNIAIENNIEKCEITGTDFQDPLPCGTENMKPYSEVVDITEINIDENGEMIEWTRNQPVLNEVDILSSISDNFGKSPAQKRSSTDEIQINCKKVCQRSKKQEVKRGWTGEKEITGVGQCALQCEHFAFATEAPSEASRNDKTNGYAAQHVTDVKDEPLDIEEPWRDALLDSLDGEFSSD